MSWCGHLDFTREEPGTVQNGIENWDSFGENTAFIGYRKRFAWLPWIVWVVDVLNSTPVISLALYRNKNISQNVYFSVRRQGFPMAKPSCKGIFAASDLATRGKDNGTPARTYHNKIRPRSICDDNFLSDIVANFLFSTSCGQWRSIVKEMMFLFKLFFWWKYVFFYQ